MSPLRALSLLIVYLPTALAECKTFCAYRTHPIEEKCGWAGCDTCVPCLPCMPHCPVATQPWEEKCELAGCGGCTECSVPPPSPPAQCKTYCAYRTHPIEEKCEWSDCNGCTECSVPPPSPPAQCKTYCAYRTHPIEEKCEWLDCNGCGECDFTIPVAFRVLTGSDASASAPRVRFKSYPTPRHSTTALDGAAAASAPSFQVVQKRSSYGLTRGVFGLPAPLQKSTRWRGDLRLLVGHDVHGHHRSIGRRAPHVGAR